MAQLVIDNITKAFGAVEVLTDISLQIGDGEFLVLVGPSGCGKSTLLNLIAGLESITSGELLIGESVVNDLSPKNRDIAMVFQSYALYPSMTVRQNITFGMDVRGVPKVEQREKVQEVADLLQIGQLLNRRPAQLSGGQRQRVAIGRALVRDPKLFLFDEPLSNLDAKLRVEMRTEIKQLHQRLGTTIVYVTHDQIEAMTLATKIAVMNGGVIQQFGTPQDIYDNPTNVFVAEFIGSPPMNIFPGKVCSDGNSAEIQTKKSGNVVLELDRCEARDMIAPGQEILVGVRPEAFSNQAPLGAEGNVQTVDLIIDVVEPTGPDDLVIIELGGKEVVARLEPQSCAPETVSTLLIDKTKLALFDADTERNLLQS